MAKARGDMPVNVLQPVNDEARRLGKRLIRAARHAALASLLPEDGGPLASRVLVATDDLGHPILLVSALSAHTQALAANSRCSLLFGEPAPAGDPLAGARLSLFGTAEQVPDAASAVVRDRFLARHPTAELYCDFPDFRFLRVMVAGASLNGGFARAFRLEPTDLTERPVDGLAERLVRAVRHMNEDHADVVDAIAATNGQTVDGWRIATADRSGVELRRGDALARVFFPSPLRDVADIRPAFVALATKTQRTSPMA